MKSCVCGRPAGRHLQLKLTPTKSHGNACRWSYPSSFCCTPRSVAHLVLLYSRQLIQKQLFISQTQYHNSSCTIHIPVRQTDISLAMLAGPKYCTTWPDTSSLDSRIPVPIPTNPVYTSHPVLSRSIWTLPSHLWLGLPRGPFPSGLFNKYLYVFILLPPCCVLHDPPMTST
jgi:hypothetical protein